MVRQPPYFTLTSKVFLGLYSPISDKIYSQILKSKLILSWIYRASVFGCRDHVDTSLSLGVRVCVFVNLGT